MSIVSRLKNNRPPIYTDFDVSFESNPLTGDLLINTNERAIAQAMKFLVLTNLTERLFQPHLGGDISKSLFRFITPATIITIKERVKEILTNFEPRATIIDVDVVAIDHSVKIDIFYSVRNREDTLSTTIFIERDR